MGQTVCPKCGFLQERSTECRRCGLIFDRYKAAPVPSALKSRGSPSRLRRALRTFRWVSLVGAILALILILWPSQPPRISKVFGASERAAAKVQNFQSAVRSGQTSTLNLDEAELNSLLESSIASLSPSAPPMPAQSSDPNPAASLENAQSSVRDVKIRLADDHLTAYVLFNIHGINLSLTLDGRPSVEGSRLKLKPTGGKLGSLPLTRTILERATSKLFDAAENREKFQLPPEIREIKVRDGRLIVSSR